MMHCCLPCGILRHNTATGHGGRHAEDAHVGGLCSFKPSDETISVRWTNWGRSASTSFWLCLAGLHGCNLHRPSHSARPCIVQPCGSFSSDSQWPMVVSSIDRDHKK